MKVIIVPGRPASHNAPSYSKKRWKREVRKAARKVFKRMMTDTDIRLDIAVFRDTTRGRLQDADNASKPICDALEGVVYQNDSQVSKRQAGRRNLRGNYRVYDAHPKIIRALQAKKEFVAIKIDNEGEDVHKI